MIYPINQQLEELLESFVDEETGELTCTEEEMQNAVSRIKMDFDEKIKALRNSYMQTKLDAECIAAEASALWKLQQETSKRANAKKNKAERTKRFIAWLLQGEKFDKDGVKIGYRKSEEVVLDDGFVEWALQCAPELLKAPEVKKQDVKTAIKNGYSIMFAHIEQKNNIQIK